jgi:hypothetical protein
MLINRAFYSAVVVYDVIILSIFHTSALTVSLEYVHDVSVITLVQRKASHATIFIHNNHIF